MIEEQLTTEDWKAFKRQAQDARDARLPGRQQEILALGELGYYVDRITAYQFRVDRQVDLYPTNRRYHVLKTNRLGKYRDAAAFIKSVLNQPALP